MRGMSKKAPPPLAPKRRRLRLGASLEAEGWIPISVASERYDVSRATVRSWMLAGLVASRRVGPKILLVSEEGIKILVTPVDTSRGNRA